MADADRLADNDLVTYRRADGELIAGEFSFVTTLEYFDSDGEATELIEERWTLDTYRTVIAPKTDGRCCVFEVPDTNGDWCEVDAVGWTWNDEAWEPRCAKHGGENL